MAYKLDLLAELVLYLNNVALNAVFDFGLGPQTEVIRASTSFFYN